MVGLAFTARDFYPRPPRGGRHHPAIISREQKEISIHALREEGDARTDTRDATTIAFLSTPSARRATTPH